MSFRDRSKVDSVPLPVDVPPQQFIMYDVDETAPDRLWTVARLEDATIDKIADRVVAKLDMRRSKVVDLTSKKKRGKK